MRPEDCLYTQEHEWLHKEGNEATVGITDYAVSQLGGITFVELPEEGQRVGKGEPMASVESVKAVSDICAPASGTISAVNRALADEPQLIDEGPYEGGWICKIVLEEQGELEELMDAEAYRKHVEALPE
ncbi:MAG: glycine cleavage system protein GcvH [Candidatus Brocadiae bacterium]|nr:glycine cleavage system protein GcvH [Candidatus Brocadiia bacterium]